MRTKESGEQEEELVVSNLRPFTLKVCAAARRSQPRRAPQPASPHAAASLAVRRSQ